MESIKCDSVLCCDVCPLAGDSACSWNGVFFPSIRTPQSFGIVEVGVGTLTSSFTGEGKIGEGIGDVDLHDATGKAMVRRRSLGSPAGDWARPLL